MSGSGAPARADSPAIDYLHHCAGCHLPDGRGSLPNNIPNMVGTVGHFLRLPEGRAYVVQVPGTAQAPLSDSETAALLNWMLPAFSAKELPADFEPYTAEEVARYRADRPADVAGQRRAIVEKLEAMGHDTVDY